MSTFADTSALVKLYADEEGHDAVRRLEVLLVAQLARVEVPAALWHKHRIRQLPLKLVTTLIAEFEADYFGTDDEEPRFAIVAQSPEVLETAARFTGVHGLRAYDAVQLATAVIATAADPDCTTFAAADIALRKAAAAEGFTLVSDAGGCTGAPSG